MQKYIVRGNRSGVFYGEITEQNGAEVSMRNARCLWYWEGAASILQIALEGVKKPRNCKFTVSVGTLTITDAIEIIPCTETSQKCIDGVEEWKI